MPKYPPGKREIEEWFDAYLARAGNLVHVEDLTPDKLYMLLGSNLSWYWDVEDVGLAPHPEKGDATPFTGLYLFLGKLIESRGKR